LIIKDKTVAARKGLDKTRSLRRTHSLRSVVLPNPAGADIKVDFLSNPSESSFMSRKRVTILAWDFGK
jgi:hypothetical protein